MGVEFGTNIIKSNAHVIKLHIWDTVRITINYILGWTRIFFIHDQSILQKVYINYSSAIGCILVFDLTDRKSFDALIKWHNEVLSCTGNDI